MKRPGLTLDLGEGGERVTAGTIKTRPYIWSEDGVGQDVPSSTTTPIEDIDEKTAVHATDSIINGSNTFSEEKEEDDINKQQQRKASSPISKLRRPPALQLTQINTSSDHDTKEGVGVRTVRRPEPLVIRSSGIDSSSSPSGGAGVSHHSPQTSSQGGDWEDWMEKKNALKIEIKDVDEGKESIVKKKKKKKKKHDGIVSITINMSGGSPDSTSSSKSSRSNGTRTAITRPPPLLTTDTNVGHKIERPRRLSLASVSSLRTPTAEDGHALSPSQSSSAGMENRKISTSKGANRYSRSNFVSVGFLGRGQNGAVTLALNLPLFRLMALKVMNIYVKDARKQLIEELKTFRESKHQNLIQLFGCFFDEGKIVLALEYMNAGSLGQFVEKNGVISERVAASVIRQALAGLQHLHSCSIIHGDIKPENILVSMQGDAKLTDFGLAREVQTSRGVAEKGGTRLYLSPERYSGSMFSFPADVWSIGISIITICSSTEPYESKEYWGLAFEIMKGPSPTLEDGVGFTPAIMHFVDSCLHKKPENRLSCSELLKLPFCKDANEKIPLSRWKNEGGKEGEMKMASKRVAIAENIIQTTYRKLRKLDLSLVKRAGKKRQKSRMNKQQQQQQQPHHRPHNLDLVSNMVSQKDLESVAEQVGAPKEAMLAVIKGIFEQQATFSRKIMAELDPSHHQQQHQQQQSRQQAKRVTVVPPPSRSQRLATKHKSLSKMSLSPLSRQLRFRKKKSSLREKMGRSRSFDPGGALGEGEGKEPEQGLVFGRDGLPQPSEKVNSHDDVSSRMRQLHINHQSNSLADPKRGATALRRHGRSISDMPLSRRADPGGMRGGGMANEISMRKQRILRKARSYDVTSFRRFMAGRDIKSNIPKNPLLSTAKGPSREERRGKEELQSFSGLSSLAVGDSMDSRTSSRSSSYHLLSSARGNQEVDPKAAAAASAASTPISNSPTSSRQFVDVEEPFVKKSGTFLGHFLHRYFMLFVIVLMGRRRFLCLL